MKMKFEHVCFHPVVGRMYTDSQFGLKVMILGESQYSWSGMPKDRSQATVASIKGREDKRFCKNIASLFPNKTKLWDQIIFYNYVQSMAGNRARQRPTPRMWGSKQATEAFKEILRLYQPDRILVLGKTTWQNMAGLPADFPEQSPIAETTFPLSDGKFNRNLQRSERFAYWYPTAKGRFALTAPIFHPGYPVGFHSAATKRVVSALFKRDWKISKLALSRPPKD